MRTLAILTAVLAASSLAAQDTFPLPASAAPGSTDPLEGTAPFVAPLRMTQVRITDRNTLTALGLPATFGTWDMSGFDPSGRYLFIPSEVTSGAGVFRYDTVTGNFVTFMVGNTALGRSADPRTWSVTNDDFSRLDPCTFTPFGTVITGEETTGGRMFEILNPLSPTGPFQVRWLTQIPAVGHEGTRFDAQGSLYVVDENNSGCVYKFVPATAGDLSIGQSFALVVDAYAADPNARPSENWNSTSNRLTNRFGPAHWVPLTDAVGNPLTTANPFAYVTVTGGRDAADEVMGTPYGRPEDLDVNTLANGNQCLYVSITSENRVISIELTGTDTAIVRSFVDYDTINLATGTDVNPLQNDPYTSPGGQGSGTIFETPDNLSVDHFGNVYIVEDNEPVGGDIWKAIDADRDGVAEAIGIFVSLGVTGSEPTGMIWHPVDPYRFVVNVQHPASGNDACWAFDTRPYSGSGQDLALRTGVNGTGRAGPGEFVRSARSGDTVEITIDSPNGGFDFAPYAVLMQPTTSRPAAFLPPLWISPFQPIVVVTGGMTGGFQFVLPPQGSTLALRVPAAVHGLTVVTQGLAIGPQGAIVTTDAHEIVLR